jgi:hypothetical protein
VLAILALAFLLWLVLNRPQFPRHLTALK